ncbi:carbon-nitrogen hydrolase family protein [Nitrospirillum amazonense]|uniref:carbon-nitrogen hydrolase family protein n=1 Tax=Nitrospirillum amazonense TaxID=28077 RepID=UPI002412B653|nr:carbon-nitrogen hydrolase family protein [Nitrospirillum amazonense]MDG3440069.1 carbon-nitrogen hydrolase family protein [Nitrospirillum amazonense]
MTAAPSSGVLRAAVLQMTAGPEISANMDAVADLLRQARDQGAAFATLPENVARMVQGRERVLAGAYEEEAHPALGRFRDLAVETGLWLMTGTLACLTEDGRAANRCFVIDPSGQVLARYDKLHMFDVELANGERYRESATFRPGDTARVVDTPWGGLGLTVCYDVRFPQLYRALAKAGARIITVPSAFTVPTGRAHWHVLLRARAIETGCWVLAPAQVGTHDGGRQTYGHALIISPWGEVVADAGGEASGVLVADLDLSKVDEARSMVPSLLHDRAFGINYTE